MATHSESAAANELSLHSCREHISALATLIVVGLADIETLSDVLTVPPSKEYSLAFAGYVQIKSIGQKNSGQITN